ncbi:MAG: PhzF family phenazine biosynthesis protein [Acidobacteriaceae bacterium]
MRTLEYLLLDVFTRHPLEGNQLAVFLDARSLSTDEMQAIARETNLAETTFILPGEGTNGAYRVRIFTVDEELPFAGHPTLGTAAALLSTNPGAREITLDLNAGKIPVRFELRDALPFGEMRQLDPTFGQIHGPTTVARAANLPPGSISTQWPIQTVSTGMPFAIVPLTSLDVLRQLNLNWKQASEYLSTTDAKFLYFIALDPDRENGNNIEARMIFYNGEDPATGSAAGCCIAWCVKHGVIAPDAIAVIHQGAMARRPSEIFVRASRDRNGSVNDVRVGGFSVLIGDGSLQLS